MCFSKWLWTSNPPREPSQCRIQLMTAVQGMGMAARAAPSPLQPQPGCQHTWHGNHHPGLPILTAHHWCLDATAWSHQPWGLGNRTLSPRAAKSLSHEVMRPPGCSLPGLTTSALSVRTPCPQKPRCPPYSSSPTPQISSSHSWTSAPQPNDGSLNTPIPHPDAPYPRHPGPPRLRSSPLAALRTPDAPVRGPAVSSHLLLDVAAAVGVLGVLVEVAHGVGPGKGRKKEKEKEREGAKGRVHSCSGARRGRAGERCRCSGAVRGGAALPSRFTCGDPRAPLRC